MNYQEFPTFKRGEVQEYYKALPLSEQQIINNFVNYVSIQSTSKARLENNKRTITQLRLLLNKNLSNINIEDLRKYLSLLNKSNKSTLTQTDFKASIKRFLKWHFKDWSERFNNLSDIKLKFGMNNEKINAETILKKEDIEKIMKEETSLYWKTFFITLYETGARPIEIRTLTWNKINLDTEEGLTEINIYATKTNKARTTYGKEATYYLKEWKKKQKTKSSLIFPAPKNENQPINKGRVSVWLKRLTKEALGREVTPYVIRHTRATELYANPDIPDVIVAKILGHGEGMKKTYTHLSSRDVKEALGKTIYQLETIEPEKKHKIEKDMESLKQEFKNFKLEILKKLNQLPRNPAK